MAGLPISERLASELGAMLREGRDRQVIERLHREAGLTFRQATEWIRRYRVRSLYDPPMPCPYCGEPLRTNRRNNAFLCGRDWHAPSKGAGPDLLQTDPGLAASAGESKRSDRETVDRPSLRRVPALLFSERRSTGHIPSRLGDSDLGPVWLIPCGIVRPGEALGPSKARGGGPGRGEGPPHPPENAPAAVPMARPEAPKGEARPTRR